MSVLCTKYVTPTTEHAHSDTKLSNDNGECKKKHQQQKYTTTQLSNLQLGIYAYS